MSCAFKNTPPLKNREVSTQNTYCYTNSREVWWGFFGYWFCLGFFGFFCFFQITAAVEDVKGKLSGFFDNLLNSKYFWNKHFLFSKLLSILLTGICKIIFCHVNFFGGYMNLV